MLMLVIIYLIFLLRKKSICFSTYMLLVNSSGIIDLNEPHFIGQLSVKPHRIVFLYLFIFVLILYFNENFTVFICLTTRA